MRFHRNRRRRPATPATQSLRDAVVLIALVALGVTVDVSVADRDVPRTAQRGPQVERAVEQVLEAPTWWADGHGGETGAVSDCDGSRAGGRADAPALDLPGVAIPVVRVRRTI